MLGHLHDGAHALDGQLHLVGDFLRRGFAAEILHELFLHAHEFVDRLDHVHGDADGAGLIGDGTRDGLANPPGRVGGELIAAAVLEFFNRLHQAHVALLNEVEEGQAAIGVFLGDGNYEAQVGLHHLGLGLMRFFAEVLELLESLHVILGGHARENLQRLHLAGFALDDLLVGGGLAAFAGGFHGLDAGDDFLVHVLGHDGHFLDDLLLVEKFRKRLLQLGVVLIEGLLGARAGGLILGLEARHVFFVDLMVHRAHVLYKTAQHLEVLFAAVDFLVHDHTIKSFLGRLGDELLRQCDVFLAGEAEAVNDTLHLVLGILNALGNLHLLFACEQGHLAHLLKVHANGVIQNIELGLLFLGLVILATANGGDIVDLGLIDHGDFQLLELGLDHLDVGRGHLVFRQMLGNIVVREVALFLGEQHEFLDFAGEHEA